MYLLYGYSFQIAWISVLYYSFCVTALLLGISFFVSSVAVFLKDASQIVNIVLQIGFWLTPVFWSDASMNEGILRVLKLNPMYYVLDGYRDALIEGIGFWQQPISITIYFWVITVLVAFSGIKVYRKLKIHFADLI